jgi:sugar lactone lactonase YvrE
MWSNRKWVWSVVRTLGLAFAVLVLLAATARGQTAIVLDPALGEFPEGVAIDKPGNLWVSVTIEPGCEVRRYTPAGVETLRVTLADNCGAAGLAVSATGVAYVAVGSSDDAVRGVYYVLPTGEVDRIPDTEQIAYPNALVLDHHNGTLYVTDLTAGAVWRIGPNLDVELWVQDDALTGTLPPPSPIFPPDFRLGANGIVMRHGVIYVAVTWRPRLVRIPVNGDGSAGTPEVVVPFTSFFAAGVFSLDGLALDVFGNFFAASPANIAVVKVLADYSAISVIAGAAEGITASPLSLAFGTGKGSRDYLFVTISASFGGAGSGVVPVWVGAPGQPLP